MVDRAKSAASSVVVAFDGLKAAAIPAVGAIVPALHEAGKAIAPLFDIIKFEIFRDFFQILSLFFSGLKDNMPASFQNFWGKVSQLISICWSCWFTNTYDTYKYTITLILFGIKVGAGVLTSLIFYYRMYYYSPDAQSQGLEVQTWGMRSSLQRSWAKYSVLILTTVYLPLLQDSALIFACDLQFVKPDQECYTGDHVTLIIVAVISCLIYIVPTPFLFIRIIKENKPAISLYDAEGQLRMGEKAYSDSDYKSDLAKDPSPFKDLYNAYERKWSYYKVIVMGMKVLLVLPVCLLVPSSVIGGRTQENDRLNSDNKGNSVLLAQSLVTLFVLGVYAVITWFSRPFLNNVDDFLDSLSRFTCLSTALFGLLTVYLNQQDYVFGIILNILTTASAAIIVLTFLAQVGPVRRAVKNFRQQLEFTPSRIDPSLPRIFQPQEMSLRRERKLRIWHEFWDILFSQDLEMRIPKDIKASKDKNDPDKYVPQTLNYMYSGPPYLLNFQGTVGERHEENKTIASHESFASYERALMLTTQLSGDQAFALIRDMQTCVLSLVGLDVWWNGPCEAKAEGASGHQKQRKLKANESATKFGKMYVTPFPFCVSVVMDDCEDRAVISFAPIVNGVVRDPQKGLEEFASFVRENFAPEVQRRRSVRQSLRALNHQHVHFHYQCTKSKTKTRTVHRDGKTETESYTVSVLFTFRNGVFSLHQNSKGAPWEQGGLKLDMSKGFHCSISYNDGEGYDHEGHHWRNEPHTIGHQEMGITHDYQITEGLNRLFGNAGGEYYANGEKMRANIGNILRNYQTYREWYFREFKRKEAALSYAFWYFIYNNDEIPRGSLEKVLMVDEPNPIVKHIPEKYKMELDMVYNKMAYYNSDPAVGFWFCFWHDVWNNNKEMTAFKDKDEVLSPYKATSLCYNIVDRKELVERLERENLTKRKSCFGIRKGFINNDLIDQLYNEMNRITEEKKLVESKLQELMLEKLQQNYHAASNMFQSQQQIQVQQAPSSMGEVKIEHGSTSFQSSSSSGGPSSSFASTVVSPTSPDSVYSPTPIQDYGTASGSEGDDGAGVGSFSSVGKLKKVLSGGRRGDSGMAEPLLEDLPSGGKPVIDSGAEAEVHGSEAKGESGETTEGQQQPTINSISMSSGLPPLPPGWREGVTAEGHKFYIDDNTKTTSWQRPT